MAHWAEIDENNIVLRVIVTSNDAPNEGYDWIVENLGGIWVQTSYNGNIRKNYAGIEYQYRSDIDAFISPQCHDNAVLDETTARWICDDPTHQLPGDMT